MEYDIVAAVLVADFTIALTFKDGLTGWLICKASFFYGVFVRINTPEKFALFELQGGVLTWENGDLDLAPDALHTTISQYGKAVLA